MIHFYLAGQDAAAHSRAGLIWYLASNQFIALAAFGLGDAGAHVTTVCPDETPRLRPLLAEQLFGHWHRWRVATALARPQVAGFDLIVAHNLLEYLPDRLVVSFVRALGYYLAPGGSLVFSGLTSSRDEALFRHVLGWGTVRRTAKELEALVVSGGLRVTAAEKVRGPGMVLTATAAG